jgi:glycosyltransferase involved in cell wall biosynthesis
MRVVGFSFIRNAEKFGYPIGEALRSILPLCAEVVVAVGNSEDGTRELVASLGPKIRIIDTVWTDSLQAGGAVLADETNKAFRAVDASADWCVYIQGDEVLHEAGYDALRNAMQRYKDDASVDGLLLKYRHFYGSFDYIGTSSKWYRHEIRVVKNNKSIYSYRDAQGFRKDSNEKLQVKAVDAWVHHYGWVRPPETMQAKQFNFNRYYNGEDWYAQNQEKFTGAFDYGQIDTLEKFSGVHPRVMQDRISRMNWKFEYDISYNRTKPKERFKNLVEKLTGKRPFDYKNYKLV